MEEDEDSVKLEALLREWHSASGNIAWTSTRLLEETFGLSGRGVPLPPREQLAAAIWEITDTAPGKMPETRLLGYKLRDAVDKTVGGYRLRRERKGNSGVRYVIECQDFACGSCRNRSTREATS
jgi:hypothetical protein